MKICFFIGSMVRGGAERVICLLANHYAEMGWKTEIVLLLDNKVDREQFQLDERIKIVDLASKHSSYLFSSFLWIIKIRSYIKMACPDCIISFIGRINALVLTSTVGVNIPILVSERSDPLRDGRGKMMQKYCTAVYKRANKIVFQTQYARNCFKDLSQKQCIVIPNPVCVEISEKIEKKPYLIATAGRLSKEKNHRMLIEAMSIVNRDYPEARCKIYGSGEQEQSLKTLINEKNLQNIVTLEGNKNNISPYLCESSIFALTSDYEGMPNALIEAMMCRNACVSTSYSGVEELIEDGVNGKLIHNNNYIELAQALLDLLSDETKRNKLADIAQKRAKRFEKDVIMKLWDEQIIKAVSDTKIY